MSISVDYDVFLDDAMKEHDRLRKVYRGDIADTDMPVLHISDTAFLKYLNTTLVPVWARMLHGNAYDHMRATYRALKVINFTREDFYTFAALDMEKQKALYAEKQRVMVENLEKLDIYMREDTKDKLDTADTLSKETKEDLENQVRAAMKLPDDLSITGDMIIDYNDQKQEAGD